MSDLPQQIRIYPPGYAYTFSDPVVRLSDLEKILEGMVVETRRALLDHIMEGVTPCTDGGCLVHVGPVKGMHTNGGCKCCRKPEMQRVLYRIKQAREALPQPTLAPDGDGGVE